MKSIKHPVTNTKPLKKAKPAAVQTMQSTAAAKAKDVPVAAERSQFGQLVLICVVAVLLALTVFPSRSRQVQRCFGGGSKQTVTYTNYGFPMSFLHGVQTSGTPCVIVKPQPKSPQATIYSVQYPSLLVDLSFALVIYVGTGVVLDYKTAKDKTAKTSKAMSKHERK